jgi:hypothetical protein
MSIVQFSPETRSSNLRVVFGQHTTVAAVDSVATGLKTVLAVVAQLADDPVDGAMHVTGAPGADGAITIKGWKSTDGDATLIAATTFSLAVNWVAVGY